MQRQALGAGAGVDNSAIADVEAFGRGLQIEAAQASTLARSALPACQAASPPMPAAREGPSAAAIGRVVVSPVMTRTRSIGTPKDDAATCAMTASAPWPCSVTPVWQMIAPCASSRSVTPYLGRNLRAADTVEGSAWIGHLDKGRKADAAMDALRAQPLLLGPQPA